ncbi:MAG: hypothetical protein QOI61_2611 [Actinomycetota bacterium]
MLLADQQSALEAVYLIATFVLGAAGSLAIARDFRGSTTRLAEAVADQNTRAPYKWFQTKRSRPHSTDFDRVRRLYIRTGYGTFIFCLVVLCLEIGVLAI